MAMEAASWDIRRAALQKIAALSATSSSPNLTHPDLDRLCKACPAQKAQTNGSSRRAFGDLAPVSQVPMSVRELEVLLALCEAAPSLEDLGSAEQLLDQVSPYLSEVHTQIITSSPFLRGIEPCPWEALTKSLTSAILSIGINHPSLRENVLEKVWYFLDRCCWTVTSISPARHQDGVDSPVEKEEALDIAALSTCLLGFLDASTSYADLWSTSEKLRLIEQIRRILTENFLISVEATFSTIRNSHGRHRFSKEWRRYTRHYAAIGRPLGAMILQQGFMRLLMSLSSRLVVVDSALLRDHEVLDLLMAGHGVSHTQRNSDDASSHIVETFTNIATEQIGLLEDGADFLQLGSTWQQRLAFAVKACVLTAYLNCVILDEDVADVDILMFWLEDTMGDAIQMADETLATAVLKCMAVLSKLSPAFASSLSRTLPRFIVQGGARGQTIAIAAKCLVYVLQLLSQDAVITTLYTLGNVLSSGRRERVVNGGATSDATPKAQQGAFGNQRTGSAISLAMTGEEETSAVYDNVIQAIIGIAINCNDDKITALAQSMLVQKIGKISAAVDARIIIEAAVLAEIGGQLEFKSLLRLYARLSHEGVLENNTIILQAIKKAQNHLSASLNQDSQLYDTYLLHLLGSIVSKGDAPESDNTRQADLELAAKEIAELLSPIGTLVSYNNLAEGLMSDELISLFRDAWFNIVVHGFTATSDLGRTYINELRPLAIHSRPLIAEQRSEQLESDVELNTVLRRGMSSHHATDHKRALYALLPSRESDVKGLSYPEVIFIRAAYLVESLRADSGDCTKMLTYFLNPSLKIGHLSNCMTAVYEEVLNTYLRKILLGTEAEFSPPYVAKQLAEIFTGCCHRIEKVQQIASNCADKIIINMPSALCQKSSLFALLELLSIMWTGCLEAETDEYEWKSSFKSTRGKVVVELSDDYALRRNTLNNLYKRARSWVMRVMNLAPLDVKGLLQTYLSEYDDDGAYGHMSLGRSFALEMGSLAPSTDQRLGAIDRHGDYNIDTASDFIAQYTTRQEYRHADALPEQDQEWVEFVHLSKCFKSFAILVLTVVEDENRPSSTSKTDQDADDAKTILAHLESRTSNRKFVSGGELRDVLRRAAALLCRSKTDQSAIVHHLVGIPFVVFTKQSIKLGISLWLGVINENPRMATRILIEVTANWEATVRKKMGIFNDKFHHLDPFFIKEEFAPSDRGSIVKRQQTALNLIGPHLRLLQFLSSHFNATRLGSPHVQRTFHRLIQITLDRLKQTAGHPLAREVHFQVILFALRILRHSTSQKAGAQRRLKDQILSAALRWFSAPPRWSFGGNRLQIKAETHLLADVVAALQTVASIGSEAGYNLNPLQAKQDLLLMLLENEQTRLMVWLFPLDHDRRQYFSSTNAGKAPTEHALSAVLKTAWMESPAMTLQLLTRFQSPKLASDARWLLLNFPEKAIGEPDALQLLLGSSLPNDVSFQLKYLLYWAPVNPVAAVTYFLPAYGNHPFILQYAMRALESHAVDVTFFYVPQIVQTLRYDSLGYVERYIIETAKFSQLFAHQIIWNMKANAYKDEDSQVPDPVKPVLDQVMESLVTSFSGPDKAFYEREFSFFNEITGISGKLRPFIKKTKPEKKQKIEEELRNIKVEVGVYLPSNPDGVVIGIDRKSGKPLQSHAKAPYMATFRIKKSIQETGEMENMLERSNHADATTQDNSIEVWQSAIFKVGDDCRQDVLALQMIAAFRGIFNNVGLDVYVYPYRVTATAPGCGVIDVLPNSISRDMLGREAVNGLYDYFVSKYGGEDSIRFQEARNNFVKSMAAYSVISYLLQFKDRHNGNIMVDDAGHILHIGKRVNLLKLVAHPSSLSNWTDVDLYLDFGFCFDIAPGGIKFERAPFKLTSEMVAVMGGSDPSTPSQSFRWFEELCIKAFLACRPYTEKLVHLVILMLDSGLPCFKPETVQHFRERFVLEKSEREAAEFMRELIRKSWNSYSTRGYDQFQLLTNGIPY
ncbi:MAG: phosphatidylinositol-4- kinase [Sclerophora amabilis]|nr:MAG: phosphatidylinositol-4- kinase [Sclerophora amabilis]